MKKADIIVKYIDGVKYTYLPPQPPRKEEVRVISMRRLKQADSRWGRVRKLGAA